jgi:hypothetical protein
MEMFLKSPGTAEFSSHENAAPGLALSAILYIIAQKLKKHK